VPTTYLPRRSRHGRWASSRSATRSSSVCCSPTSSHRA